MYFERESYMFVAEDLVKIKILLQHLITANQSFTPNGLQKKIFFFWIDDIE